MRFWRGSSPNLRPCLSALIWLQRGPHKNLATMLDAKVGDGRIAGQALLNLPAQKAKLDLDAHVGAMQFASMAGWQSLTGSLHLQGPFLAPLGQGEVTIDRLTSSAAQMERINLRFDGHAAARKAEILSLRTQIDQLRINALPTHPFDADPIIMNAIYQPEARGGPVHLKIAHRIFQIDGDAETKPSLKGRAAYTLPDLSPFAALGAVKMVGHLHGKAQFACPARHLTRQVSRMTYKFPSPRHRAPGRAWYRD